MGLTTMRSWGWGWSSSGEKDAYQNISKSSYENSLMSS
jgi:hypothetical protein